MKTISIIAFAALFLVFSCNKSGNATSLQGEWRLIEVLADPGDGSGMFTPVSSNKTIEFFSNGTIASNGELCFMTIESNSPSSGTYELLDHTISANCIDAGMPITFNQQGDVLIVTYPCIEACQHKYKKQ